MSARLRPPPPSCFSFCLCSCPPPPTICLLFLFLLVTAAVLILRRTMPNTPRTYRVPAVPVTPVAAIIGNGVLVVALLFLESSAFILGLVWIALGLVIHYAWAKRERIAEVAGPI